MCSCYIFRSRRIRLDEAFVLLFKTPFCNLLHPSRSRNYVVPFLSYIFRDLYLLGDASVLSSRFVSSGIFFVLGVSGLEPDVVLLLLLFSIAFFFQVVFSTWRLKTGASNAQRHQISTRYITLRNTLPGHHLISCFQCGSEAATPQTHYTLTTFAIVTSATASGWHPITLPHKRLGLSSPQQCSGSKTVPDTSYCKIL